MLEARKEKLTSTYILVVPNLTDEFMVCTNVLIDSFREVLMKKECMIVYEYRKIKDDKMNYPTHNLELVGVVHALFY